MQFGAIMKKAAVNFFVQGLYVDKHFRLLDKYLEMELLDHRVDIRSTF